MKHLSKKQIEEVAAIRTFSRTNFHGNTKKVGSLPLSLYLSVIEKRKQRELLKHESTANESEMQKVRRLLFYSQQATGTPYYKIMIDGNTGIYYASPYYGHQDYNKYRVFEKNEKTLRIMNLFNTLLSKNNFKKSI